MIVYRNWVKVIYKKAQPREVSKRLLCDGWFLFGLVPLYLRYLDVDTPRP